MIHADFSICLIGRNEARTLPRLEKSLAHVETDRHYVDTGSTDNSCAVAESLGYEVVKRGSDFIEHVKGWECDRINKAFCVGGEEKIVDPSMSFFMFEKARNFSGTLGQKDFIFGPDCDEYFSALDVLEVNKIIKAGATRFGFQYVYSHNPDGISPWIQFYADSRFWDRKKDRWYGFVHETLSTTATYVPENILKVEHEQEPGKEHRSDYLAGLAVACWRLPSVDRNFHYFGRELLARKRPLSALKAFQTHLDLSQWDMERASSLCYIGDAYQQLGDEPQAASCWHSAFDTCGAWREPWMRLAWLYFRKGAYLQVASLCEAALVIPHPKFYGCIPSNYTVDPHALAYWAYAHLGRKDEGRRHWLKCREMDPTNPTYIKDEEFFKS